MKQQPIIRKTLLPNSPKRKYSFTRTGPTSAVVASVYPSEEVYQQASAARNTRMDKAAHRRKNAEVHQGEVILKLVR